MNHCKCTINSIALNISEEQFAGILCAITSTFSYYLPFNLNVDVSSITSLFIPMFNTKSWSLKDKLLEIRNFCNELKRDGLNKSAVKVTPIGKSAYFQETYYLHEKSSYDFAEGYSMLSHLLTHNGLYKDTQAIVNNYRHNQIKPYDMHTSRDPFEPINTHEIDQIMKIYSYQEFIDIAILVAYPGDKYNSKRIVTLDTPCYEWEFPLFNMGMEITKEKIMTSLVNLFLKDCSIADHTLMAFKKHYLRIFLLDDASGKYCYMYLGEIGRCMPRSRKDLSKIRLVDELLCEVVDRGCSSEIYKFSLTEWNEEQISELVEVKL